MGDGETSCETSRLYILHPAGAGGGSVQQPVVVGGVLIHSGAWQYTQVCDLLESLHLAGTGGGDVQQPAIVGGGLVLQPAVVADGVDVLHPAGAGGGDIQQPAVVGGGLVRRLPVVAGSGDDLASTDWQYWEVLKVIV